MPGDLPLRTERLKMVAMSGMKPGGTTLDRELEELLEQEVEDGDHDRFSHYVQKDKILKSALSGKPVIALCGKVWTPGRDPQKFPICPTCKEIYEKLKA
jgi:hypothetical protein